MIPGCPEQKLQHDLEPRLQDYLDLVSKTTRKAMQASMGTAVAMMNTADFMQLFHVPFDGSLGQHASQQVQRLMPSHAPMWG